MSRRIQRVGELLREELSHLLQRQLRDPRLSPLTTITEVKVSPDLSQAKVYFSVMGSEEEKVAVQQALEAASGYLRRELAHRLSLRRIPELSFHRDDSMERAARILSILDAIARREGGGSGFDPGRHPHPG